MKRRAFLQVSAALAGGTAAWRAAEPAVGSAEEAATRTTVLVTSAQLAAMRRLAAGLSERFAIRLTATESVETELPFTASVLEPGEALEGLVQGVHTIVHTVPPGVPEDEVAQVDSGPRQLFHLLHAAHAAGVRRVIYLSSIALVSGYDPAYQVDEDWRPWGEINRGYLPVQLNEFTCREFARERKLQVVVLRLGTLVSPDGAGPSEASPAGLDERDLLQAVQRAIEAESPFDARGLQAWSVIHILSRSPGNRFPLQRARRLLGYEPQFG